MIYFMKYFKTRCTEWCNFIKYTNCTPTFQATGYKRMMQLTHKKKEEEEEDDDV